MENFKKKSTLDKAIEKFYRIDDIKDLQKTSLLRMIITFSSGERKIRAEYKREAN